jgi:hypothetical protein
MNYNISPAHGLSKNIFQGITYIYPIFSLSLTNIMYPISTAYVIHDIF